VTPQVIVLAALLIVNVPTLHLDVEIMGLVLNAEETSTALVTLPFVQEVLAWLAVLTINVQIVHLYAKVVGLVALVLLTVIVLDALLYVVPQECVLDVVLLIRVPVPQNADLMDHAVLEETI